MPVKKKKSMQPILKPGPGTRHAVGLYTLILVVIKNLQISQLCFLLFPREMGGLPREYIEH